MPAQINLAPGTSLVQRRDETDQAKGCCHQKMTLADPGYQGQEEYGYYLPARHETSAAMIVSNNKGQLLACDYRALVFIKDDVVIKEYLCLPQSSKAIDLRNLQEVGYLTVKIHSHSPVTFEDFVEQILRHPPDQAKFVRYLNSEGVREDSNGKPSSSPPSRFYCQHHFVLYKAKLNHREELRRWAQN